MEKRQFGFVLNFQQVTLEQLNTHRQKNKSRHRPYTFHKN